MRAIELEEARRDQNLQLRRQLLHRDDGGMLLRRPRPREQALVLLATEVGSLKQFGREHDLSALARRLAHELGHGADVRVRVVAEGELQCGNGELGHRSEEHTSELQSRQYLVCRLLLEKKKRHIRT